MQIGHLKKINQDLQSQRHPEILEAEAKVQKLEQECVTLNSKVKVILLRLNGRSE